MPAHSMKTDKANPNVSVWPHHEIEDECAVYHDFLLLNVKDYPSLDYSPVSAKFFKERDAGICSFPDVAKLSMDLVDHIRDQIEWIDSVNPGRNNEPVLGLCYNGVTGINRRGAPMAKNVFGAWANLLQHGPEPLLLTGPDAYECDENGDPILESRRAVSIKYPRDSVVGELRKLERFAEEVCSSPQEKYILHFGI